MKRLRIFVLVSLLAALAGCSNSFVYNQLDWLIPWYLGDYVDLNREQQRAFKEQLGELLRWHRSEPTLSSPWRQSRSKPGPTVRWRPISA